MSLAEKFHRADVNRFLSELPAWQPLEWLAYYNVLDVEDKQAAAKRAAEDKSRR